MQSLTNIDLNLLVVLDALLRTQSIKEAGALLGRSPSATSHALQRLRELLTDPLLVRAGSKMTLTPRARLLEPRVRDVLERIEGVVRRDADFVPERLERTFRVGATDYAELFVIAGLSARLGTLAPGVTLYSLPGGRIAGRLRDGELDLAIGVYRDLPPDVHEQTLFMERFVCVVRAHHPVLDEPWTLEAFVSLGHVLIAPGGVPHGAVDRALEPLGHHRRIVRTVGSFLAAPELVATSDHVLTVAERVARRAAPALGLVVLDPPLPLRGYGLSMVWHRRDHADPVHQWLRGQVGRTRPENLHRP
ncbi:MAG: LysR family transcriptional regulator [Myxococcota bacterium]